MRHSAKHCRKNLMHWLLVLALAFSPLQSATAALSPDCDKAAADISTGSHTMASDDHDNMQMDSGVQQTCCDHDCCDDGGTVCSHGCSQLHAWTVIPATTIHLDAGLRNALHAPTLIGFIGQIPPALLRPPRSSV